MAIELRSGTARAVILPEHGGRLHQLLLDHEGREEPLLWSPADPAAYDARPTHGGSFPMAPWPNRIAASRFRWRDTGYEVPGGGKPNAIHGRVLDVPWDVVARTARVCELTATFDEGWPWPGKAWQRFELSATALRMKLEVRAAREPFPAGCGWHPWFRRDAFGATDVRLTLPASELYLAEHDLPTGEVCPPSGDHDFRAGASLGDRRVDSCYRGLSGPIEIDWGARRLHITVSAIEPHVMLYTPDHAFCIEPQTCAPDAFNLAARGVPNTGLAIAAPGRPVAIESTWSWS